GGERRAADEAVPGGQPPPGDARPVPAKPGRLARGGRRPVLRLLVDGPELEVGELGPARTHRPGSDRRPEVPGGPRVPGAGRAAVEQPVRSTGIALKAHGNLVWIVRLDSGIVSPVGRVVTGE